MSPLLAAAGPVAGARLRGAALVAGAALCWSSGGILVRLLTVDGWTVTFWRSAFMTVTLGFYLLLRERGRIAGVFTAMGRAGLLSGLLLAATFICYILALAHTQVANVVVMQSASPLVSALLARLVLGEALQPRTVAVIAVAFAGIALMFADLLGGGTLTGCLFGLGVALCFGTNTVVLRANRRIDMVPATVLAGLFSAAAALPLAAPGATPAGDLGVLAVLGSGQLALGLFLFVRGTPHLSAAEVGLLSLLETVLAPIWAWIGVGEAPAPLALAGGGIVVLALAVHSATAGRRRSARALPRHPAKGAPLEPVP